MRVSRLRLRNDTDKRYQKSSGAVAAANFNVNNRQFNVDRNNADNQNENNGVRGGMRIYVRCYVLWAALSHPPSILPVSPNMPWIWKIFVSFAILSSSTRRNLSTATSSMLLARIKYDAFRVLGAFLAIMRCERHSRIVFSKLIPRERRQRFSMWLLISTIPLYASYILLIMGNDSIDLGLKNIWCSWFRFRKGKRATAEMHNFQYCLEKNLLCLFEELNVGTYRHGGYKKFIVSDNKRREISVASIRDRVVHRLVYDYLNGTYNKTFIFDAWSCRVNKGLLGAIERAQAFLKRYPRGFVWKADIKKFFDSVDQKNLLEILSLRIKDKKAYNLLGEIIYSFPPRVVYRGGGGRNAYWQSYEPNFCQYLFQ